jgi:hypothetical protein
MPAQGGWGVAVPPGAPTFPLTNSQLLSQNRCIEYQLDLSSLYILTGTAHSTSSSPSCYSISL